jgi:hypothetical protein
MIRASSDLAGVPSRRSVSGTAACCLKFSKTKVFFSKKYQALRIILESL